MIITQTPYRISFFGGGTDYKPYFMEYGGSVISTTIDKYCYLNVRYLPPFFTHKSKFSYSKIELPNTINEIEHPSIRECMRYMNLDRISISHDGDLPARSGLGTSSSFTVGLLLALHTLKGEYIDKMTLAKQAIFIEQEMIKENVGVQDQLAVAFGSFNRIYFTDKGYDVCPIIMTKDRKKTLNNKLMLFFTGLIRTASQIAAEQINNVSQNVQYLKEMNSLVGDGEKILSGSSDLDDFGRLLNDCWQIKRQLSSNITNDRIDNIYSEAMKHGAIGGKLLGAGGGGFLLFYVPEDRQEELKNSLGLLHVPFEFEEHGSRVVHYTV